MFEFRRDLEPTATIASGTRCVIETEDAFSNQIAEHGDRRDLLSQPYGNPLTGPIAVDGAAPGDVVEITIHDIAALDGAASTYAYPTSSVMGYLGSDVVPQDRRCQIDDSKIHWDDKLTLPYEPMIGTVGVLPPIGQPSTAECGDWGGNMDLVEIGPGSILELPVFVSGAGLYFGDCHALQGAAEWSGAAMEMRAAIDCTIAVRRTKAIPGPRILRDDSMFAVGVGRSIEAGIAQAYSRLALWLEAEYGRERWDGYCLLTQVGRISLGYHALGVVAAGIERRFV